MNKVVLSIAVLLASPVFAQQLPTAIPQTKFASGQDVVPYFEGWIRNKDGSFDMVFGYFNRNWQEELAVPAGPDNLVEPGGPDRGQPTFFLPRRQGWVYRVRVPSDFGKQVVTWTIKANGRTEKAYGELMPVEEITERIVMTRGNLNPGDDDPNRPPAITIAPVQTVSVSRPVTLVTTVTDDGLPKPRPVVERASVSDATRIQAQANASVAPRPRGLTVSWMQLRGPAKVTFDATGALSVVDGRASVDARFSAPGTYVLRATANDGALATKSDVTIVVGGGAEGERPIVDNERVTVWLQSAGAAPAGPPPHAGDAVWVSLSRLGDAAYNPASVGGRGVFIVLKDRRVPALENTSGYPNAFPRPGVRKILENDRVIVWDYSWRAGQPSPMHFHDKDVVVTYVADGALTSTTPDGQSTMNEFTAGTVRFNTRDRAHTEAIAKGQPRAIITELK
ncbi:MAG TPA: hypothetical protein VGY48_01585 [Vicinamibacterales bacterium]|jgi:hypothetical protein|nr:hypothetical protein [Vicinamibacterales bacterium]